MGVFLPTISADEPGKTKIFGKRFLLLERPITIMEINTRKHHHNDDIKRYNSALHTFSSLYNKIQRLF